MAGYSDETRAKIARLWAQGLACSLIATQCGMSKNAIVGLVHRMGLPGRPSPIKRDGAVGERKVKVIRERPKVPAIFVDHAMATVVAPIMRMPSRLHSCTWPHGDPRTAEFRYCGDPAIIGRSYCEPHLRLSRRGEMYSVGGYRADSVWNEARDARLLDMARRGLKPWQIMAGLNELPGRRIEFVDQVRARLMRLQDKQEKAA